MVTERKMGRTAISKVDFYPDDWLAGTSELNPEQRSVYITLCALYWSKQGYLQERDHWLAGMNDMSVRKFRKIKSELVDLGKIEIIDGFIYQERAEIELKNAQTMKDNAAEKGRKGGQKSAEIRTKALERNKTRSSRGSTTAQAGVQAATQAPARVPIPIPIPPPYGGTESTSSSLSTSSARGARHPASDDDADFDPHEGIAEIADRRPEAQVVKAFEATREARWGHRREHWLPEDLPTARRWLAAGATTDLCAEVFRLAGAKAAGPPGSLAYFEEPIARAIAAGRPRDTDGRPLTEAEQVRYREILAELRATGTDGE